MYFKSYKLKWMSNEFLGKQSYTLQHISHRLHFDIQIKCIRCTFVGFQIAVYAYVLLRRLYTQA